jgi:hypothetical protein
MGNDKVNQVGAILIAQHPSLYGLRFIGIKADSGQDEARVKKLVWKSRRMTYKVEPDQNFEQQ